MIIALPGNAGWDRRSKVKETLEKSQENHNQNCVHQNKLDALIERKAYELFTAQGLNYSLIEFKITELQICVTQGYNTRAEILRLIKKAGA